ncbi:hypothetical protein DL96DRAFT_1666285 [Flagelloscypha sp. PMI_526]|nr:hypothetical protein DL96DRAFT_1666285 [Flagelloscypha sp. PMI_526]
MPPSPQVSVSLIPEQYIDYPSQRLYVLSLACLCQAIKVFDFIRAFTSAESSSFTSKWIITDTIFCLALARLRIPRLRYNKATIILHISMLCFFDALLFGGLRLHLWERGDVTQRGTGTIQFTHAFSCSLLTVIAERPDLPSTPQPWNFKNIFSPFSSSYDGGDAHLLGQHTIRLSPISTAQINPQRDTFCLSQTQSSVLIPVLLNNTDPVALRYTLTPLGPPSSRSKPDTVDMSARDIRAIEAARLAASAKPSVTPEEDDYDEYDDDEDEELQSVRRVGQRTLQNTQSIIHLRVSKPGTVKLERVIDASHVEARLAYYSEVVVTPCPKAQFTEPLSADEIIRCSGDNPDLPLRIDVHGVPPLSLKWQKVINGQRQQFVVEGIEGDQPQVSPDAVTTETPSSAITRYGRAAQHIEIPLTIALDTVGLHQYLLEEISDGVGNIVRIPSIVPPEKSTRSARLLRRPAFSFKQCGAGLPRTLLIGSEARLSVSANDADSADAPWEVFYKYQPPEDGANSKHKPYKKSTKTEGSRRDLVIPANAPGEYTLLAVKGQHCEGDILAPDACPVIEKPLPTAEIEWQKIHECSGDTGVSASLVMHGTPPFILYYRMQRDKQPPRDLSKTFPSSRGELTIQPQDDGHFVFSITQLSDANYQRVAINAPSIDQVIHPLASAEFVQSGHGRKRISSCGGNIVEVDVDLKGTGPWNEQDTLDFKSISTPRKRIQIPIPAHVDKSGGAFDIALSSVTDKEGCKRALNVPGITVNVRRILPTVKFYGQESKRRVTILEGDEAKLPLRLTGDGVRLLPFRLGKSNIVTKALPAAKTVRASNQNDFLIVRDPGNYELLEVVDSECPGAVVADASNYHVDWVPRPSVRLSEKTKATHIAYNGSYVLDGICEGLPGHVDLDLTGRSPFEIMYNIAKNNGNGGTEILDQPVFNSIQQRTRFDLHTQSPGRFFYEVKQVGDAAYPLEKHRSSVIPRSERLLIEQQVHARPSAKFLNRDRLSYCLLDPPSSHTGVVHLEGAPPFSIELSIRNLGAGRTDLVTVEVDSHIWKVDLPAYQFESIGAHLITIESVKDASGCAHAALDPLRSSIWADVAETALIVPVDRRQDFCVGDISSFQMEGIPPWTIGYKINGKAKTQEARSSPFSLIQQHAGEFTITSISHQQARCRAAGHRPSPYSKVGHGKRVFQDIHEGDQAEILFTLEGEPPFTFTYQRAEPMKRGGKPGKVLETHTVSRIMTREYSVFSAQEGTWTVTSIADKYCRYPPVQPGEAP